MKMPAHLLEPLPDFAALHRERVAEGVARLANSSVAFVGLARNCAVALAGNLARLEQMTPLFGSWRLHIEENDSADATVGVLTDFCSRHPRATFTSQTLHRGHYGAEFAGRRTIALAEYRDTCQRWVRDCAADADYVAVVDWDARGGWTDHGFAAGIGWLVELQGAYGMASVSLFQYDWGNGPQWAHYDLWALRGLGQRDCYWDTYQNGHGGFGYSWLPAVGSPPALVASAFGGLAIYRTDAYLAGTYDGTEDCEHVTFHRSIAKATGQLLYVCPAMRTVMNWMEPADAGHSLDGV